MAGGLPDHLQEFIWRYIVSVEKLEILLLLASSRDKYWSVDEAFRSIQSSQGSIQQRMRELKAEGFVEQESNSERYRFRPKSDDLTRMTLELADVYRERRIKVIEAIFAKSEDKLRRFSDAFRLRKEEE